MEPEKLRELARTCRELGITSFKSPEVSLELAPIAPQGSFGPTAAPDAQQTLPDPLKSTTEAFMTANRGLMEDLAKQEAKDELDPKLREQLEQLTSVIRMGDSELLDRLFPTAKEATQDEVVAAAEVE